MEPDETALDDPLDEIADGTALDESLEKTLDEVADELRVVLLTESLGALELCCIFGASDLF